MNRFIKNIVPVNPFNPAATGTNKATSEPPLGIAYLAAVLRERGYECQIIDADILELDAKRVLRRVRSRKPSMFGLSCNIVNYPGCRALTGFIRSNFPDSLIVTGGPFASSQPELCLSEMGADAVAIGEGEETIKEIAGRFTGSLSSLGGIKGLLIAKEKGDMVETPQRPLIENLDEIPFPARDLLPRGHPYGSRLRGFPADAILTSRGCPYHCTYCNKEIYLNRFRARSVENVMAEIDLLSNKHGIRQLDVLDENFTLDKNRAEKILDEIISRPYTMYINMMNGIRADRLSEHLVNKMRLAGVFCVSIGVESGDQEIVDRCKKRLDLNKVLDATRWLRKAGIIVYGNFMFGLPGDTPETMQRTLDFSIKMNPHIANFQIACPFPGTELYSEVKRKGRFIIPTDRGVNLGFYAGKAFFELEGTHAVDVEAYFKKAYRRFYFRLSKIMDLLCTIRSMKEAGWLVKAASDKIFKLFS